MSAINVNSITGRTGTHGPVLTGVTTATNGLNVTGGNVGIGTDNPQELLDVAGIGQFGNDPLTDTGIQLNGSVGRIRVGRSGNVFEARNGSDSTIRASINGITGSANFLGSVGIGTDSPTKSLSILSSQSVMLQLESTSTTSRIGFKVPNTGSSPTVGVTEEETLEFRTGAAERLRISSNGHIGAGTTLGLYGPGQLIVQSSSDLGYRLSRNSSRNCLEFVVETAGTSVENHFSVNVPNKNIIIYIMMDYVGSRQSSSDAGTSRIGFENYVITRREDSNVVFTSNIASQNYETAGPDAGGVNDKQAVNPFMQRTGTEAATETQQVEVQVQPRCSNGSNGWVTSYVKMIINGTIDANDFRVIID